MRGAWFVFLLVGCVTNPETGRKAFLITSESQEQEMGREAYKDVLKKEKLSGNVRWNALIQRVGQRISAVANKPDYQWEFKLIDSPMQNAFCLPGGKVAFYTGIFDVAQNEAGVATVMGHEVAHATARHGGQRISQQMGVQLGLVGLQIALGDKNSTENRLLMGALGVGANIGLLLPFSRSHESEADEIGLIYMAKAGYDPSEAHRFWERFSRVTQGKAPPEFLSTHPSSSTRQHDLMDQVPRVIGYYERSPQYGVGEKL